MTENLKSFSNDLLLSKTQCLVSQERNLTVQILHHLSEINRRRLYLERGYPSLFMFCVKHLGFTESQTQRRIEAMRVLEKMPEIETKIKEGALSLTALAQAQCYFRQNNIAQEKKAECLAKLENKSTRECEREILKLSPIKQITENHGQLTITIPNPLRDKLLKIQMLLSHKNPNMSQSELLEEMAEICLSRLDPERRKVKKVKEPAIKAVEVRSFQRRASTAPHFHLYRTRETCCQRLI